MSLLLLVPGRRMGGGAAPPAATGGGLRWLLGWPWGWFQGKRLGTNDHVDGHLTVQSALSGETGVLPGITGRLSLGGAMKGEAVVGP